MNTASTIRLDQPEDVPDAFQAAWNAHDMLAFGALFDDEATFVNRFGHYVKGVKEIVALHVPIHETIYRDSTLKNELIEVVQIADGAAVIHFWSRLAAGTAHPAGPHEVDTLILVVLTRQNDLWRIRALENVTLTIPESEKRSCVPVVDPADLRPFGSCSSFTVQSTSRLLDVSGQFSFVAICHERKPY